MKPTLLIPILSLSILLAIQLANADESHPSTTPIAEALIEGLRTGNFADLSEIFTVTVQDFHDSGPAEKKDEAGINPPKGVRPKPVPEDELRKQLLQVSSSFAGPLEKLKTTLEGIDLSSDETIITVSAVTKKGQGQYPNPIHTNFLPLVGSISITLHVETDQSTRGGVNLSGEYEFVTDRGVALKRGWWLLPGFSLVRAPAGVIPADTAFILSLQERASKDQRITQDHDPSLETLASNIVRVLANRDANALSDTLMISLEEILAMYENYARIQGTPAPPESEIRKMFQFMHKTHKAKADEFLATADVLGLPTESSDYEVGEVLLQFPRHRSNGPGGFVLESQSVTIQLSLTEEALETRRPEYRGEFSIEINRGDRTSERWTFMEGIRWAHVPAALLTPEQALSLKDNNYLAQTGALAPGTKAPNFEYFDLHSERKYQSADLAGKVILLEFWASWCGPCQGPMEQLQNEVRSHPEWQDEVVVIALSIDDTQEDAIRHLKRKGWDATTNVWAGPGGWRAPAAEAYSVRGIPKAYLIDQQGVIVKSGRLQNIGPEIARLLKP